MWKTKSNLFMLMSIAISICLISTIGLVVWLLQSEIQLWRENAEVANSVIFELNDQVENKDDEIENLEEQVSVLKQKNERLELNIQSIQSVVEAEPISDNFEYTDAEVKMLAMLIWGEARGVQSYDEQAAVAWCVLNRVDSPEFPDSIVTVILQNGAFTGYNITNPVEQEFYDMAESVLELYSFEQKYGNDAGRVLPKEYVYFHGAGTENLFRINYVDNGEYYTFPEQGD